MPPDDTDDALSHLDERIAEQFAQLGWRPSERDVGPGAPTAATPTTSELAALLVDLFVRIDRMERHLGERDEEMAGTVERALSELGDRVSAAETPLHLAAASIDQAVEALLARREEIQRADRPLQQVSGALDGMQAAMRAQLRLLAALQESVAARDLVDIPEALGTLREHGAQLAARVDALERHVAEAAGAASGPLGGAGEAGADARPAGRDFGDELVEVEGRHFHGGDERMF
jgi:ABC-type transporter Mla subunit MlaD